MSITCEYHHYSDSFSEYQVALRSAKGLAAYERGSTRPRASTEPRKYSTRPRAWSEYFRYSENLSEYWVNILRDYEGSSRCSRIYLGSLTPIQRHSDNNSYRKVQTMHEHAPKPKDAKKRHHQHSIPAPAADRAEGLQRKRAFFAD